MTTRAKVLTTGILLVAIAGLAATDAYVNHREITAYLPGGEIGGSDDIPDGAVMPQKSPDVAAIIEEQDFTTEETTEMSLIEQVVEDTVVVHGLSILKDGDRAGSVTWIETDQVKRYFIALKESLLPAFSPKVSDLRDTTDATVGQPVRNILSFSDPGLSEERVVFVRVRERLYEFHIATGKEGVMNALIEELTSR